MVKVGETFDCYNAKSDSTDQSNKFNKTRVIIQKQIFTEMGQLNDFWNKVQFYIAELIQGQL